MTDSLFLAVFIIEPGDGNMTEFNAEKVKDQCVAWIRDFFEKNGPGCNAIVGISGGKDSSVAAALCVEALGRERVIGVLMPNGEQHDIDCARQLVAHLGIQNFEINVKEAVEGIRSQLEQAGITESVQAKTNLPPRIRMSALYAVSQSLNGRVVNTCNLSEDWVGYSTRYGDAAGDFSPMSHFTTAEIRAIGKVLNLPQHLVEKTPIDGLCGKTDEDNLGFTYAVLDKYIRTGICEDEETRAKIDRMYKNSRFKLEMMPAFEYKPELHTDDESYTYN